METLENDCCCDSAHCHSVAQLAEAGKRENKVKGTEVRVAALATDLK